MKYKTKTYKKHSNKQRQTLIKLKSLNWFTFCFICIIFVIIIIIFYLFTYPLVWLFDFLIWISSIIIILCSVKDDCRSFVVQCSVTLLLLFLWATGFCDKISGQGLLCRKIPFLDVFCNKEQHETALATFFLHVRHIKFRKIVTSAHYNLNYCLKFFKQWPQSKNNT